MASGGFTGPLQPAAPRTAMAGARTPPLAVLKASQTAKERIVDNKRADESLGISRDRLALSKQTQARLEADALAKQVAEAAAKAAKDSAPPPEVDFGDDSSA